MSATANLRTAEIGLGGSNMRTELPLLQPTIGPPMVDVRSLHEYTGCFAYDPALGETGTCRSTITYVDGDNGILSIVAIRSPTSSRMAAIWRSAGYC